MNQVPAFVFMPPDLSEHGAGIDTLMFWLHALMGVLFIGWGVFFVYTLIRFRRKRSPAANYHGVKSHASSYVEVGVVAAECLLLFGLAIPLWGQWVDLGRPSPETAAQEIHVIAQQFAWNVHYPGPDGQFGPLRTDLVNEALNPIGLDRSHPAAKDDFTTINQLIVPADRPVVVRVTSKDVIHSFFLPVMRVKQDAIPGMSIPVGFEATKTSMEFKREEAERRPAKYRRLKAERLVESNPDVYESVAQAQEELESRGYGDLAKLVPDFEVACAQLCGGQHYAMRGFFHILSPEEFEKIRSQDDFNKWIGELMMWQFSD